MRKEEQGPYKFDFQKHKNKCPRTAIRKINQEKSLPPTTKYICKKHQSILWILHDCDWLVYNLNRANIPNIKEHQNPMFHTKRYRVWSHIKDKHFHEAQKEESITTNHKQGGSIQSLHKRSRE